MIINLTKKEITPYWNKDAKELSEKLNSEFEDFSFVPKSLDHSWFFIESFGTDLEEISFKETEKTIQRTKKIRIYPTKGQEKVLSNFFGASRFFYNKTIDYIQTQKCYPNRYAIQKEILKDVPEWAEKVPYMVKQMGIDDACKAYKNNFKKAKKEKKQFKVHFRKKRDRKDSFYISKESIDIIGFYKRSLKEMRYSEEVGEIKHDCRVVFQKGYYYVIIPSEKKIKLPENQRKKFISLDPGVRTFQTLFSDSFYMKIGCGDFKSIFRICKSLDDKISMSSKSRRFRSLKDRLLFRLKNKISEIHYKTANFLVKNFENIIIPEFKAQSMVGKLISKTCRSLLTWAHSSFRTKLIQKAEEYSCNIVLVNEAYTSKTCSFCGKMQNIGSKKIMKCTCGKEIDRDINGARGIFLLAVTDPSLPGTANNS